MRIEELGDVRVSFVDTDGGPIGTTDDVTEIIGSLWGHDVGMVAIPVERLDPAFFDLSTRLAGEVTQKFVNYRLRVAVIGDVSSFEASSDAFSAYVWESNRGTQVWFVDDEGALADRLGAGSAPLQ